MMLNVPLIDPRKSIGSDHDFKSGVFMTLR